MEKSRVQLSAPRERAFKPRGSCGHHAAQIVSTTHQESPPRAQPVALSVHILNLRYQVVFQGKTGLCRRAIWAQNPDPLLTSCMTRSMMLNHSESQFSHLKTGDRSSAHLLEVTSEDAKPCLVHSHCSDHLSEFVWAGHSPEQKTGPKRTLKNPAVSSIH